jgi:hypothetical protein
MPSGSDRRYPARKRSSLNRYTPPSLPSTGLAGALDEPRDERHVIARDRVDQAVGDPLDEVRQGVPSAAPVFEKLLRAWNADAIGITGRVKRPPVVGGEGWRV